MDRLLKNGHSNANEAYVKLQKRLHAVRMANEGGHWHTTERRRLEALDEHGHEVSDIPCTSCPVMTGEMEFQILEGFTYQDFPFDKQVIKTEVIIKGADLFTCRGRDALAIMGLTEENAQTMLLPLTGTWILNPGEGRPLLEAVTSSHPVDELTGEPIRERCRVEIFIRRNWAVFFVKQIATMLLVTAGGLMALFMQPGDLFGDRCAQLVVSVLIVLTSMQMDIGLGSLSYLIWLDYFNIMQLLVLLVALLQTMILHRLDHAQFSDLVIMYDKARPCLASLDRHLL